MYRNLHILKISKLHFKNEISFTNKNSFNNIMFIEIFVLTHYYIYNKKLKRKKNDWKMFLSKLKSTK